MCLRTLVPIRPHSEFYLDELRQARLPRWSNGRIVLTGDAAWCANPLAGMGASLAIIGAYVHAGEMAKTDDLAEAFYSYGSAMRPIVKDNPPASKSYRVWLTLAAPMGS